MESLFVVLPIVLVVAVIAMVRHDTRYAARARADAEANADATFAETFAGDVATARCTKLTLPASTFVEAGLARGYRLASQTRESGADVLVFHRDANA